MPQELGQLQTKWVEALESGEYQQGHERLCHVSGGGCFHCCLGVALELLPESIRGPIVDVDPEDDDGLDGRVRRYGEETHVLPAAAKVAYRMRDESGLFDEGGDAPEDATMHGSLAEMNDFGWSFREIAAFLRKYPDLVFEGPA
jgi:hypothetical protein